MYLTMFDFLYPTNDTKIQLISFDCFSQTGSWAGNLMLKHKHHEFPSDIFLTLLAVDAQLTLIHADTTDTVQVDLETFLTTDMSRRLITAVTLSPMAQDTQVIKVC